MSRFDSFVYVIPKRYTQWGNMYANPRAYFSGTESMWNSRLNLGFSVVLHEGLAEYPHFHHSVEEYYMFSGADLTKFFDFDAEIEVWMGEDPEKMEKIVITQPTLLRIPPNMWHGPINYKRVNKPVAFSSVYFDGELSKITRRVGPDGKVTYPYISSVLARCVNDKTRRCINCGSCVDGAGRRQDIAFAYDWAERLAASDTPHTGRYDQYVFTYPKEFHKYGDLYANPRGKFRGQTQMPGARFYGGFSVVLKDLDMEVPHCHHANDEYLWFIGSNLLDPFDFDAEVELFLGEDPDHMEKIVITEPTVVRVPPLMWHCPIHFTKVKKPVAFLPIYSDGDWSKIIAEPGPDGNREYLFEAASLRRCSYNRNKICNYCGECLKDDSVPSFGVYV